MCLTILRINPQPPMHFIDFSIIESFQRFVYAPRQAGIIVGSLYFTYTQGVWGDQRQVTECIRRWQEYYRSINTRRPPVFDKCGNVIVSTSLS